MIWEGLFGFSRALGPGHKGPAILGRRRAWTRGRDPESFLSEAVLFHQSDYPVPGHGKVWFAETRDRARLRLARWRPTVRPARGTVVVAHGRAEFIERYSETIAELRRRGF